MTDGEQFRARVALSLDLEAADPVWLELFGRAVAVRDRISALEAVVAEEGWTSPGAQGQLRVHPLLPELRATELTFSRLLTALGVDETGETKSRRQSRIAKARRYE